MDLNQINLLPNTAKEKYMTLGKLFEHPAYSQLTDWAKQNAAEAQQRCLTATAWEHFVFNRGQQLAFEQFTKLEDIVETEFCAIADAIAEQKAAEAEMEASEIE